MALRVLLADESTTIKRVIQLALQDYAVEVRSVPVGLDVLPVAKTYKPDIVFADILLPKRTGYDVCGDLKSDSETQQIPVILMWSSFMELDSNKASFCQADGRLEKPFETEQLRTLVQSLVPKLQSNPISSYLKFPKLPDFSETSPSDLKSRGDSVKSAEPILVDDESTSLGFQSLDESFQQIPLHHQQAPLSSELTFKIPPQQSPPPEESSWARQDLNEFKLNLPNTETQTGSLPGHFESDYSSNFNMIELSTPNQSNSEMSGSSFEEIVYETPKPNAKPNTPSPTPTALDIALTEKIIRDEAQKMLENMLWKILPDIAERIVREEINKLLKDQEKT